MIILIARFHLPVFVPLSARREASLAQCNVADECCYVLSLHTQLRKYACPFLPRKQSALIMPAMHLRNILVLTVKFSSFFFFLSSVADR